MNKEFAIDYIVNSTDYDKDKVQELFPNLIKLLSSDLVKSIDDIFHIEAFCQVVKKK